MKKKNSGFIIFLVSVSIALQGIFIFFFFKAANLNDFLYIKDKIEKPWLYSHSVTREFKNFSQDESTAIFMLPSLSTGNMIIADSYDHAVALYSSGIIMFSVYPSGTSSRKHKTIYIKDINEFSFKLVGDLFYLVCEIGGDYFFYNFLTHKSWHLLPPDRSVF